jgi:hypothetical protein
MTLFALQTSDDLLSVRFAVSPVWETQAAVQALADERGRTYHQSWLMLVRARAARLDLALLLAALPRRGYVPDFLTPPPRTARPSLRGQLAEIRATDPAQVARELERCRDTVDGEPYRRLLTFLLSDPERARDLLAARLHDAWAGLVAPYWVRIRALLDRDVEERSRALTRHGLRRVLDELHPKLRWSAPGLTLADRSDRTVQVRPGRHRLGGHGDHCRLREGRVSAGTDPVGGYVGAAEPVMPPVRHRRQRPRVRDRPPRRPFLRPAESHRAAPAAGAAA